MLPDLLLLQIFLAFLDNLNFLLNFLAFYFVYILCTWVAPHILAFNGIIFYLTHQKYVPDKSQKPLYFYTNNKTPPDLLLP